MATPASKVINGSEVVFSIRTGSTAVAIAYSRKASISMTANMLDVTTKESVNGWAESIPTSKAWSGSVDGLMIWGTNMALFTDAISNRTQLELQFSKTTGLTGDTIYSGSAWIESVDIDASQDEALSYSVKFTGNGALNKTVKA